MILRKAEDLILREVPEPKAIQDRHSGKVDEDPHPIHPMEKDPMLLVDQDRKGVQDRLFGKVADLHPEERKDLNLAIAMIADRDHPFVKAAGARLPEILMAKDRILQEDPKKTNRPSEKEKKETSHGLVEQVVLQDPHLTVNQD